MNEINGRPAIEQHIGWPHCSYNNDDISYSSVITLNYIKLNMFPDEYLETYDCFLKAMGFVCIGEFKPKKDKNHKRVRKYIHSQINAYDGKPLRVNLFLYPPKKKNTGITTKIYYPTNEILGWFVPFFSRSYMPNVSYIEFTFDFFTEQIEELYELLKNFVVMKYNRSEPNKVKKTWYQSKKVISKGMRLYIKDNIDPIRVRLELMMKRRIIRELGIKLETLDQDLQQIDLSNYFGFKVILEEKYIKRQEHRMEKKFKEDRKKKFRRVRKSWTLDDSHALHRNLVDNAIANLLIDDQDGSQRPAVYINSDLKKCEKQHYHFSEKLPEMDEIFFSGINGRSFL